jgi:hypothetical protein
VKNSLVVDFKPKPGSNDILEVRYDFGLNPGERKTAA